MPQPVAEITRWGPLLKRKNSTYLVLRQAAVAICVLAVVSLGLSGCGLTINSPGLFNGNTTSTTTATTAVPIQGYVGAQQWSVSGASVQLYAAGTQGMGSSATALLTQPVETDGSGNFTIPATYPCPTPASQLYIVASGGNPGLASGTSNKAIRLLTMLGPCNEISASTVYPVNEVTTVGSIWPLSSYMASATQLGSAPSDPSFTAALTKVNQLVNLSKAVSPGTGVPAGYAVQSAKLNTLASDLHACVFSPGGAAGDGSPCGQLFSFTTAQGASAPTDTIEAALHLAQAYELNVESLFQFAPSDAAFQPVLVDAPTDWDLDLVAIPAPPVFVPAAGIYAPGQQVTISSTSGATLHYTVDGSMPSLNSPVYSGPLSLMSAETVRAVAITDQIGSSVSTATFAISAQHLGFTSQPPNVTTNAAFGVVVSILDQSGKTIQMSAPITLSLNSLGSTTLSGSTTVTAVNGIATFQGLSVPSSGTAYTISASSPGIAGTISAPFNATSHTVATYNLVFTAEPSNITEGTIFNPAPAVSILDGSGNLVANSTAAITLKLTTSTGGAALSGTTTVKAVGGVAVFPGLTMKTTGSAYTLTASGNGLASAISKEFNVASRGNPTIAIPPNATQTGDLAGASNWEWNHDPGTPGDASGTTNYPVSTPSLDGAARVFNVNYSDHGGEIYHLTFANDPRADHFVYDTYIYITDPSQVENVEMDMNHTMANGVTVILGTQCASGSGTWEYTLVSGGTHWHPSNIPCHTKDWTANTWHHIQIATHHDSNGFATYDWVNVDGHYSLFKGASGLSAESLGWGRGGLLLNFQLDGSSRGSGSITTYIDSMTVYRW
jgi:hypothetical protein